MSPDPPGPGRDREPRPGGPLQHLDAATHPVRDALRSLRRIRFLRAAVLTGAVLLLAVVAGEIWTHRARRKPTEAPPPLAQPENATQTLDKFEYTATAMGKLAYRILADKLTGVEGGLHTVQGIRRAEFKLADGRTLTASADHGTFNAEAPAAGDANAGPGASGAPSAGAVRGHGHVVLEGHVLVTSDAGERLESDRIEYFQAASTLVSPAKCRFRLVPPPGTRGGLGPSEGEAGSVTYDLTTKLIAMKGGVVIHLSNEGAPETVATSAQARFAADGTSADLDGDARVTRGEEYLSAPRIQMTRSEDGDRTRVVAATGAKGRVLPGSALAARAPGSPGERGPAPAAAAVLPAAAVSPAVAPAPSVSSPTRTSSTARPTLVAAQTIDATDVASTGERRVTLKGAASLEEAPVPGLPPGRSLSGRTIVLHEAPRAPGGSPRTSAPRTLHAEGSVRATFPPGPGESVSRVLTCERLDALTAPDGSLATADADGTVTLQSGPRRSVSARAHMVGETHVELRGARPVVEEPEHRIVADEIDYETRPSQLVARGSVQTRFVPTSRGESRGDKDGETRVERSSEAPPSTAGSASRSATPPVPSGKSAASGALPFTPGIPVDVLSDTAVLKQDAKTAEFTGRVRARQVDRALSADHLLVDDTEKTARADGSVSVRSFREEKPSAPATGAAGTPAATRPIAGGGTAAGALPGAAPSSGSVVKIPVQVDADSLVHDDGRKVTRLAGDAVYREPGRTLKADSITLEGGSDGTPATTRAQGHVVYEGEGKRGTGDLAVHHEEDKTVTLEGHERPAQVLEIASGRSWRGPSLTWVQATDSIPVVTGTSGRSRIVGSISSQQRDDTGKPADRGKPR